MTFTPKTPAFEKAVKDSRNLKAKPDNDELLEVCAPLFNNLAKNLAFYSTYIRMDADYTIPSNSSTPFSNKAPKTLPSPKHPSPGCST